VTILGLELAASGPDSVACVSDSGTLLTKVTNRGCLPVYYDTLHDRPFQLTQAYLYLSSIDMVLSLHPLHPLHPSSPTPTLDIPSPIPPALLPRTKSPLSTHRKLNPLRHESDDRDLAFS